MTLVIPPDLAREMAACEFVCGSDEVGYGSWAGPLVVCATVVPRDWAASGVTDSKKLTPAARERAYATLVGTITHSVVEISSDELDRLGVSSAWEKAHREAIQGALDLHYGDGYPERPTIIIDGNRGVLGATALPKADLLIPAVSAASIIAKVHHDRVMLQLAKTYPGYDLESNMGYGTRKHQEGLRKLGVSPVHRKSYSPMAEMLKPPEDDLFDLIDGLNSNSKV